MTEQPYRCYSVLFKKEYLKTTVVGKLTIVVVPQNCYLLNNTIFAVELRLLQSVGNTCRLSFCFWSIAQPHSYQLALVAEI